MPDRRQARYNNQYGYSYRHVDRSADVELETPQDTTAGGISGETGRLIQTRRTANPVVDALLAVGGEELGHLRTQARERQAIDGAVEVGLGAGMDEIAKRKSFDDWVFGTNARVESAAKVKASSEVTAYASQQLSNMSREARTSPDAYIKKQREIISRAAKEIEERYGPEVREAFVHQASQRLQQLVSAQTQAHHEHLQYEASNNFQRDLKERGAYLAQLYTTPGMEWEADAELEALFNVGARPDDMTEGAYWSNVAQAIMSDVLNGNRHLYEYADQKGVLDAMPEQQRDALDKAYKQQAPINDLEFIDADEKLRQDILNPAVSYEEFVENQKRYIRDWDMAHSYSDEQLAQQRIRKQNSLKEGTKKADNLGINTQAYMEGDHAVLAGQSSKARQAAASNALLLMTSSALDKQPIQTPNGTIDQQAFNEAPPHQQRQYMFQALQENPDLLNNVVERSVRAGYVPNELKHFFNDGMQALTFQGAVNPKAAEALELQRQYRASHPDFASDVVKDHATLEKYDTLRANGYEPDAAVLAIQEGRQNPVSPTTFRPGARKAAEGEAFTNFQEAMELPRGGWGLPWSGREVLDNQPEIRAALTSAAEIHMEAGHEPSVAYAAAANEMKSQYELVGNTAVRRDGELKQHAGLKDGQNFEKEAQRFMDWWARMENTTLPEGFWKAGESDFNDYHTFYDQGANRLLITPRNPDDITQRNRTIAVPLSVPILDENQNVIGTQYPLRRGK